MQIQTADGVLGILDNYQFVTYWALFVHRGLYSTDTLNYAITSKIVTLNMTQPLLEVNGMLRRVLNTVSLHAICTSS